MSGKRTWIVLAVACACLALAAVALARSKTFTGKIKNDANSSVALTVKVSGKGAFTGIKKFVYKNVDTCVGELSGKITQFSIQRSTPRPGVTGYSFIGSIVSGGNTVYVEKGFLKTTGYSGNKPKNATADMNVRKPDNSFCPATKRFKMS